MREILFILLFGYFFFLCEINPPAPAPAVFHVSGLATGVTLTPLPVGLWGRAEATLYALHLGQCWDWGLGVLLPVSAERQGRIISSGQSCGFTGGSRGAVKKAACYGHTTASLPGAL